MSDMNWIEGLTLIGVGFIMGISVVNIMYLILIGISSRGNSIDWERDFPNGSIAHAIRRERIERRTKLLAKFGIKYWEKEDE